MCGIFAIFHASGMTKAEIRKKALALSKRQRHRGPDDTGIEVFEYAPGKFNVLVHERLSIVDPEHGH